MTIGNGTLRGLRLDAVDRLVPKAAPPSDDVAEPPAVNGEFVPATTHAPFEHPLAYEVLGRVTLPRGSWMYQDAFKIAAYRPYRTNDGRLIWRHHRDVVGKSSWPQLRRRGYGDVRWGRHNEPLDEDEQAFHHLVTAGGEALANDRDGVSKAAWMKTRGVVRRPATAAQHHDAANHHGVARDYHMDRTGSEDEPAGNWHRDMAEWHKGEAARIEGPAPPLPPPPPRETVGDATVTSREVTPETNADPEPHRLDRLLGEGVATAAQKAGYDDAVRRMGSAPHGMTHAAPGAGYRWDDGRLNMSWAGYGDKFHKKMKALHEWAGLEGHESELRDSPGAHLAPHRVLLVLHPKSPDERAAESYAAAVGLHPDTPLGIIADHMDEFAPGQYRTDRIRRVAGLTSNRTVPQPVSANADPTEEYGSPAHVARLLDAPDNADNASRQLEEVEQPAAAHTARRVRADRDFAKAAVWHASAARFHAAREGHGDAAEAHRQAAEAMRVADPTPHRLNGTSAGAHELTAIAEEPWNGKRSVHDLKGHAALHGAAWQGHFVAAGEAEAERDDPLSSAEASATANARFLHHMYWTEYHKRREADLWAQGRRLAGEPVGDVPTANDDPAEGQPGSPSHLQRLLSAPDRANAATWGMPEIEQPSAAHHAARARVHLDYAAAAGHHEAAAGLHEGFIDTDRFVSPVLLPTESRSRDSRRHEAAALHREAAEAMRAADPAPHAHSAESRQAWDSTLAALTAGEGEHTLDPAVYRARAGLHGKAWEDHSVAMDHAMDFADPARELHHRYWREYHAQRQQAHTDTAELTDTVPQPDRPVGNAKFDSPLHEKLHVLRPHLAAAAQKEYDAWDASDPEHGDAECGFGGICHLIADSMSDVLHEHGIEHIIQDRVGPGDPHVWVTAHDDKHTYHIDINPHHYETGGGYNWQKIPGVKFTKDRVSIDPTDRRDLDLSDNQRRPAARNAAPTTNVDPEHVRRLVDAPAIADMAAWVLPTTSQHPASVMAVRARDGGDLAEAARLYRQAADAYESTAQSSRIGREEQHREAWRSGRLASEAMTAADPTPHADHPVSAQAHIATDAARHEEDLANRADITVPRQYRASQMARAAGAHWSAADAHLPAIDASMEEYEGHPPSEARELHHRYWEAVHRGKYRELYDRAVKLGYKPEPTGNAKNGTDDWLGGALHAAAMKASEEALTASRDTPNPRGFVTPNMPASKGRKFTRVGDYEEAKERHEEAATAHQDEYEDADSRDEPKRAATHRKAAAANRLAVDVIRANEYARAAGLHRDTPLEIVADHMDEFAADRHPPERTRRLRQFAGVPTGNRRRTDNAMGVGGGPRVTPLPEAYRGMAAAIYNDDHGDARREVTPEDVRDRLDIRHNQVGRIQATNEWHELHRHLGLPEFGGATSGDPLEAHEALHRRYGADMAKQAERASALARGMEPYGTNLSTVEREIHGRAAIAHSLAADEAAEQGRLHDEAYHRGEVSYHTAKAAGGLELSDRPTDRGYRITDFHISSPPSEYQRQAYRELTATVGRHGTHVTTESDGIRVTHPGVTQDEANGVQAWARENGHRYSHHYTPAGTRLNVTTLLVPQHSSTQETPIGNADADPYADLPPTGRTDGR